MPRMYGYIAMDRSMRMQAGVSLVMAGILIVWTGITFRQPLPRPLPDNLGINYNGFCSIAVMPISLFSASVFRCRNFIGNACVKLKSKMLPWHSSLLPSDTAYLLQI